MDTRELKGLEIAATKRIQHDEKGWRVPSQTDDGTFYTVRLEEGFCSCPDHEVRQVKCKHLFAVEYTVKRETDGTTTTTITATEKVRVTYPQNWTAYNAAQTEEKEQFVTLLADLCSGIPQPRQTTGRPRLPLSDMVFACAYKVYSGFSTRRFASDMGEAHSDGLMATTAHFNRVSSYLSDPILTPVLKHLITTSSLPLKMVETDFAVDSTGFGTSRFVRWFNKKYGREIDNREWVKAHVMAGVKTHVVTSVEITGWSAADSPYFRPLVEATAQNFQIGEVSADKAYTSHKALALVESLDATPFMPFRSNTVVPPEDDSAWTRMYHYYMFNRQAFLEHYHKRSNVETVFSMVKGKFGDAVRSKTDTGQVNEVLCKVLAHICVVNQSIHELGIEPTFRAELAVARKVAV